jgi:transposase InsO family protein
LAGSSGKYPKLEKSPACNQNQSNQASRETYASPRIHQDLVDYGERVSVNRVARLMRQHGIQSKMSKKFIITTDSKNTLQPALYRLKRQLTADTPDKAWVTDTTSIPTRQGWFYLAVVIELYSRQLVGWAMSYQNNTQLVQDALTMAIWRRGKTRSVIVHSDQGSTYASADYRRLCSQTCHYFAA